MLTSSIPTDSIDYSASKIVAAIHSMTSPNKAIQEEANSYMDQFTLTSQLHLDIIGELIASNDMTLQLYAWNFLYRKMVNKGLDNHSKETPQIRQVVQQYLPQTLGNAILLRPLIRNLAYLVYRDFEENNFEFLEQPLEADLAMARVRFLILIQVAEFIKNPIFHSKKARFIENEIRQYSAKISADLRQALAHQELAVLALEAIGLLACRINFLEVPSLTFELSKLLEISVNTQANDLTVRIMNTLIDIIFQSNSARTLETFSLDPVLARTQPILAQLEKQDIDALMSLNTSDSNINVAISQIILARNLLILEKSTPFNMARYLSNFLYSFPQFLFIESNLCVFLLTTVQKFQASDLGSTNIFLLGFEWIYSHMIQLDQCIKSLTPGILEANRHIVLGFVRGWLRTVTLKSEDEAAAFVNYYVSEEGRSDLSQQIVDDRTSVEELLADLCMAWLNSYPNTFFEDLTLLIQEKIAVPSGQSGPYFADVEAAVFFVKTILGVIVEVPKGPNIVREFLGFVLQPQYLENKAVLLSLVHLSNHIGEMEEIDEELKTPLLSLSMLVLENNPLSVMERVSASTINKILGLNKQRVKMAGDFLGRLENYIFAKQKHILASPPSIQQLSQENLSLKLLVSAFLSAIEKAPRNQQAEASQALDSFFGKVVENFSSYLNDPSNQPAFYLFLIFVQGITDVYETNKDLNDIDRFDIMFMGHIDTFMGRIVGSILARFEESFASPILKKQYYQTVKDIVLKFGDTEVPYFQTLFGLVMSVTPKDPERLILLDKMIIMNVDSEIKRPFLASNIPLILSTMMSQIQIDSSGVILTQDEDYESDAMTVMGTLVTHFAAELMVTLMECPNYLAIIESMLQRARTLALRRETIRFQCPN